MKLIANFVLAFGIGLCTTVAWGAGGVSFSDHGKLVKTLTLEELLAAVPAETIRIFEPHEEAEMTFRALPLDAVLDQIYGKKWRQAHPAEEAFFICADGYRDPISFEDLAKSPGWLAFERVDHDFSMTEKNPKVREIPLAPLYLIRASGRDLAHHSMSKEGWPYQVVGVDLIEFADRFPGLVPPKSATPSAIRGYQKFRQHCVTCHALGGQGGKVGPELNSPVSVTTYYQESWLRRWIADPSQIRTGTPMPAVIPKGPDQAKTITEIMDYLKAMAPPAK